MTIYSQTFFACTCFLFAVSASALPIDVKRIDRPKPLYEIPRKNLYAIGLTADPAGLITIINGNIYVARNDSGKIVIDTSMKTIAAKLAHLEVVSWLEVPLVKNVSKPEELGQQISDALKKLGFENANGIPFLIKGKFRRVDFHVGESPTTAKASLEKSNGIVFGLFTKTRSDTATAYSFAWNFVAESGKSAGTIDALETREADHVTLFLPR